MLPRLCTKADFLEERNCSREAKNALELLLLPLLFVCLLVCFSQNTTLLFATNAAYLRAQTG